jgi:hypothetical protein
VRRQATRLGLAAGLALALTSAGSGANPGQSWLLSDAARAGFREIWETSVAERRERVGCMGGAIAGDTVFVVRVQLLPEGQSDSLTANAEASLGECAAPEWIGTVHTHVRSTDSDDPAPRFSPGDRAVMSEWSKRYGRGGAFCVLYSAKGAHCEVWPPRSEPRVVQPWGR